MATTAAQMINSVWLVSNHSMILALEDGRGELFSLSVGFCFTLVLFVVFCNLAMPTCGSVVSLVVTSLGLFFVSQIALVPINGYIYSSLTLCFISGILAHAEGLLREETTYTGCCVTLGVTIACACATFGSYYIVVHLMALLLNVNSAFIVCKTKK